MTADQEGLGALEAVRRCRVVAGVLVLLHLGLGATPQAVDLLIALGQDGSVTAWLGLGAGTAWLALNAWFWSGFELAQPGPPCRGRFAAALPSLLGAASLLVAADVLRTASSSIPEVMGAPGGSMRLLAASAGLGAACLPFLVLALRAGRVNAPVRAGTMPSPGPATRRMLALSVMVGVAGLAGFATDPVRAASALHPASTVLLAAAGLMCGGTLLLNLGRRTQVPVLFLAFALAAALAALRDREVLPDNHDLRRLPPGLRARPDVEAAFLRFLDAAGPPGAEPIPVVLVAASGGGISAAYWTATVLGDLADASPRFAGQVFALSGVSGGALGLLTYVAALQEGAAGQEGATACRDPADPPGSAPLDGLQTCLQLALGGDFLGPALGAMLYPDLLQRFVPVPLFADRAAALETAWEARWHAVFGDGRLAGSFLGLWRKGRPWPALLLNGTSLNGGGRLVASNLQLGADHVGGDHSDLLALLGGDIPASAAAGSSARFPYIGPLGTFRTAAGTADAVADGGYFENLGASTLLELLDALDAVARRNERQVRFVVLQLVNDSRRKEGWDQRRGLGHFPRNALVPAAARADWPGDGAAAHPGRTGRQRVRGTGPARRRPGGRLPARAAGPIADRAHRPARLVVVGRGARGHQQPVDARVPPPRPGRRRLPGWSPAGRAGAGRSHGRADADGYHGDVDRGGMPCG